MLTFSVCLIGCGTTRERSPVETRKAEPVQVPETYRVRFETTKGDVVMEVNRAWAPRGADRFHELVRKGFYNGSRLYRVRPKFVVQFGISTDTKMNELWRQLKLVDDPMKESNQRGYVSYATDGPNTRTTQVFINLADNKRLDGRGFAPFGRVVEGMDVVDQFYSKYGEVQALGGAGPDAVKMETQGDEYVQRSYPLLDQIRKATVLP